MHLDHIQITVVQVDNYGPWTETLGPDRESRLQVLQARLYAFLQENFSSKGGIVFFNRFDEMVAVTNGITVSEHKDIASKVERRFPVTVSMGIGSGADALEAAQKASAAVQSLGSAQSPLRRSSVSAFSTSEEGRVEIAHLDIKNVTRLTDKEPVYVTSNLIITLQRELIEKFQAVRGLVFYLGGDNFMGVSAGLPREFYRGLYGYLVPIVGGVRISVANATRARRAAELATQGLDRLRKNGGEINMTSDNFVIQYK
jgi:GTP cyclohydrolase IIa